MRCKAHQRPTNSEDGTVACLPLLVAYDAELVAALRACHMVAASMSLDDVATPTGPHRCTLSQLLPSLDNVARWAFFRLIMSTHELATETTGGCATVLAQDWLDLRVRVCQCRVVLQEPGTRRFGAVQRLFRIQGSDLVRLFLQQRGRKDMVNLSNIDGLAAATARSWTLILQREPECLDDAVSAPVFVLADITPPAVVERFDVNVIAHADAAKNWR